MKKVNSAKFIILGSKSVGKTAFAVRFLTKRFIGDYQSDIDVLYKQEVIIDDVHNHLEVLDTSENKSDAEASIQNQMEWADGFMVIYSILDRKSFQRADQLLKSLVSMRCPFHLPITLIGNKRDLELGRQVDLLEGRNLALKFNCQFYEISAADGYIGATMAFETAIKEVRMLRMRRCQRSSSNGSHKKIIKMSMSKVFGVLFKRNENQSDNYIKNISYVNSNDLIYKHKSSLNLFFANNPSKSKKHSTVMIPIKNNSLIDEPILLSSL